MIFTARQIQEIHKASGEVRLPVGARLTPMAMDWLRSKKIEVSYHDGSALADSVTVPPPGATAPAAGGILWWCDGPCGQAKAAIAQQARETFLAPMAIANEPGAIVDAVKHLAGEINAGRAPAGILIVKNAAAAVVYANRCPSLRAILGTCREAVQQGVDQLAANVLIIEYPYQSLQQVRNLLGQFVRVRRTLSSDVERKLKELTDCG